MYKFESYRLITPIVLAYRWRLIQAVVALISASILTLCLPLAVRVIVDAGVANNLPAMKRGFILLLVIALSLGFASAYRFYMVSWLGERVVSNLRIRLFEHLLSLPSSFYDKNQIGELLSRLTTDTTLVEQVVGTSVSMALRNGLLLLGALVMLLITSSYLTMLVLVVTPLLIIPVVWFARRYRLLSKESQAYIAQSSAFANQVLSLIDTTKAYQYESAALSHFNDVVESGFTISKKRIYARSQLTVLIIFLMISAMVAIMWVGAVEVFEGQSGLTSGELGQFFVYSIFVATSVGTLSEVWGELMRASGALGRIIDLLAQDKQQHHGKGVLKGYDVEFEDVSFAYPQRHHIQVLHQVSFRAEAGKTTAIVGMSGAGKSTIFKLLMQYYIHSEGQVKVGGQSLADLDISRLRAKVAIVSHQSGIFPVTIRQNIALGRSGCTDNEVEYAAKLANIADFIEDLPDGYDTVVGEKGVLLSEGQRQRVALARAILKDAPIVLLDEATNALDAITEDAIGQALSNIFVNKTVIVIAHRLSTVKHADQIVLMDQGLVVATGDHQTLKKQSDIYAKLAEIQLLT